MNFLISDAFATTGAPFQRNYYSLIIMLLTFSIIIYFMILRPQQKRIEEYKKLTNSISKGDEIITTGGLVGLVTKITTLGYVTIALNETTEVIIKRDFISSILPKGTIKKL
ncbi:preprotein translocase subunit YajC [Candidatus Pantoea edessiphila]|uniref:Sec translocon accessory complex subunit YajC n=1 Tax=Candidatus Pantoea edessiphila TaxID=2044610 RepID=A0A2P5SXG6_9GAMM|nr:preprotein translocase subunit YajC [Candidatus Pantoea edessiphila]MBK4775862.1 preprotein translocase subunit YajC [Pantoea sp. Edef]PPI87031.1 preprotein translocase subunit YajC [Candidatus Pantoea edessiphila]